MGPDVEKNPIFLLSYQLSNRRKERERKRLHYYFWWSISNNNTNKEVYEMNKEPDRVWC